MGKLKKLLMKFLDEMTDETALSLADEYANRTKTKDFYVTKSITSTEPKSAVIEIRISRNITISTADDKIGQVATEAVMPIDGTLSADDIRKLLRENCTL